MKSLISKSIYILLITCLIVSCDDEESTNDNSNDMLVGHWNSYEQGNEQVGFTPFITTLLTINYDSGLAFSSDGTFKTRYYNYFDNTWTESTTVIGTFEIKDKTISLTFSPLTSDEYKLDLQIVKLDKRHLWFKHTLWGENEYHLERTN